MTDAISGSSPLATNTATTQAAKSTGFDSDTFLQLLVAQLKYQDPSNPTSSSEFMAQTATLAQVQSLNEIADQNSQALALQRSLSAGALVGHTVSYTDSDGSTKTGTVTSVKISNDGATESKAVVDGVDVALGRVSAVSLPTA
jgi:flagellar basal-body rod modification protein FlgD